MLLHHSEDISEQVAPVSQGNVQGSSALAAAAIEAVRNGVCGASWDVAQSQVGSHLSSLPSCPANGQQPVQDLLEQPITAHLQKSLSYC